jgi:hypothetical protein
MGRKKRNANTPNQEGEETKKQKTETGESYLVKKYRATKSYAAMEAFVKYTKSHRMLDATYIRWRTGVTPEKSFVFSTRVGGVDLGWGRGKTREAAMDCACRAAFALVSAHGYNNFPVDDDCLMQAPVDLPPPPPPPLPPPPPGAIPGLPPGLPPGLHPFPGGAPRPNNLPPHPTGMPPLPPGLPPGMASLSLPATDLIPQPQLVSTMAPTASSLSGSASGLPSTSATEQTQACSVSMSLNQSSEAVSENKFKKKLKGGLILVYDPEADGSEEMSMEERRARLDRYQKSLRMATAR